MKTEYNSQSFTPEEVKKGLHSKFLDSLLQLNIENDKYFNDIHITSDGYCIIIEWEKVPYDHEWGGRFEYVGEDQEVLKLIDLPNGHYEYVSTQADEERLIQNFIASNPQWRLNAANIWVEDDDKWVRDADKPEE